ncbi:hypothetical protein NLG97_g5598 [Lecanicillium saksenae]|uniref:Uncharacterized protein n=1 Tax=Lecanicillium saksenae TaxID=468837 RepID=A0ACC1QS03_9HYPO|nr:hypothetical protein NLG97_g5598 [Lecanicillium saksenae]
MASQYVPPEPSRQNLNNRLPNIIWNHHRITMLLGFCEGRFKQGEEQIRKSVEVAGQHDERIRMTNEVVAHLESDHRDAVGRITAGEAAQMWMEARLNQIESRLNASNMSAGQTFAALQARIINLENAHMQQRQQLENAHQMIANQQSSIYSLLQERGAYQEGSGNNYQLATAQQLPIARVVAVMPNGNFGGAQPSQPSLPAELVTAFRTGYDMIIQHQRSEIVAAQADVPLPSVEVPSADIAALGPVVDEYGTFYAPVTSSE